MKRLKRHVEELKLNKHWNQKTLSKSQQLLSGTPLRKEMKKEAGEFGKKEKD